MTMMMMMLMMRMSIAKPLSMLIFMVWSSVETSVQVEDVFRMVVGEKIVVDEVLVWVVCPDRRMVLIRLGNLFGQDKSRYK